MRFGTLILLILLLSTVLQLFLPWWSLALAAFAGGYFIPLPFKTYSFWAGFIAGFLLWGIYALFLSIANDGLLAAKVGVLLGGIPAAALPFLSGLFAAILSGMAALSGRMGQALTESQVEKG